MKRSSYLSLGVLALVSTWMLSGQLMGSAKEPLEDRAAEAELVKLMKVRVSDLNANRVAREVVIQGQLEPLRRIDLRTETAGQVVELPVIKGSRVSMGQSVIKLAKDDRPARLARAKAELARQEQELTATSTLYKRKLRSKSQLRISEAALAAAKADLQIVAIDLARTNMKAPFDGVLETLSVELGSVVKRGDRIAVYIDDHKLKAVGQAPQQSAASLSLGQLVDIRLIDGRTAAGKITYISRVAEAGTRSFRIEAEIDNPGNSLSAGVSAELRITVATEQAHFLSPAVLTLDTDGQVGVKTVDETDHVQFYPISLVRSQADGIWVSGLPDHSRVITQGQGFVSIGETVEPVAGL